MKEMDFIQPKKTVGKLISVDVFDQINEEIDNLDTYTIHMGSAQLDKVCVEFKDVKKIIAKYINKK